jgi:demethylmenaquinone methyltransferase/2-methoxy-6-polyprenyl-1,4-benzoquinol methylase
MPPAPSNPDEARFEPRASREMADMFDDVSGRYDFLNRVMTLGRDGSWRAAMAAEVPDDARVVVDLCTGTGTSLEGLRQPGRLVVGVDVSRRMLQHALEEHDAAGWAPILVCADAFRLPMRDASVDCVTIAFGIRNLRPRDEALAEIARVMRPGGRLIVLEATAPGTGALAPMHRFHLTHVVPWLGRMSSDPSAYAYLSRSILEFGPGDAFERSLGTAGFRIESARRFLMGATTLWVACTETAPKGDDDGRNDLQTARAGAGIGGRMPTLGSHRATEWKWWTTAQLVISIGIFGFLIYAGWTFRALEPNLPLERWQRQGMQILLLVGLVGFAIRSVILALRLTGPPPRL